MQQQQPLQRQRRNGKKSRNDSNNAASATTFDNSNDESECVRAMMTAVAGPSSAYTFMSAQQRQELRRHYEDMFDELAEVVCGDAGGRVCGAVATSSSSAMSVAPFAVQRARLPTLQIGFVARAMGLNLSNDQVILLTELVEDDAPSRGSVSCERLRCVIVDALLTGVLAAAATVTTVSDKGSSGSTNANAAERMTASTRAAVVHTSQQLTQSVSRYCQRDDAARILRAFQTLDTKQQGFVDANALRLALTTMGDRMPEKEVEEMMLALLDPDTGVAHYRDFVDVLAYE